MRIITVIVNSFSAILQKLSKTARLSIVGAVCIFVGFLMIGNSSHEKLKTIIKEEQTPILEQNTEDRSLCVIQRGESLYQVIVNNGGNRTDAYLIGEALKPVFNPRKIRTSDRYMVKISSTGRVTEFTLIPNLSDKYIVMRQNNAYTARKEKISVSTELKGISGSIKSSLYESLIKQGVSPEVIVSFAEIFAWDIDFFNDTRNNDSYWLIWEEKTTEAGQKYTGKILGASYKGRITGDSRGIYFTGSSGKGGYYDLDGTSLRRSFLRAPLTYRRISSHFSYRRFHPILRIYRPHTGIDYAAPSGTPVETVGDGIVTYKGWKGQSGKTVLIKHNSVYTSQYGHLSRYGKNLNVGKRVSQGQVIGYVGSTGLSTGPHLDFRFMKFGKPINFLKLKMPPVSSVPEKDKAAFKQRKKEILQKFSEMRFSNSTATLSHVQGEGQ